MGLGTKLVQHALIVAKKSNCNGALGNHIFKKNYIGLSKKKTRHRNGND